MLLRIINYNFDTSFDISSISNIVFAFAAFSFNEAAYNAETIRASILSVDRKDIEAAHSLGMTGAQTMRRVILPQAMIVAIPNLAKQLYQSGKSHVSGICHRRDGHDGSGQKLRPATICAFSRRT